MPEIPEIEMNVTCKGWPERTVLCNLVRDALAAIKIAANLKFPHGAELSLLFCDDQEISRINQQFRGINKPTNVLSFPDRDMIAGESAGNILGDIAFALQTTKSEARLENKPFEHHLSHLVIHGFLHLFGYDHIEDDEAETMERLETIALRAIGISNPYGEIA